MKIRLEPYKLASKGGKAFAKHAGILRVTARQLAKYQNFDILINWGNSERRFDGRYINDPDAVSTASNKLSSARCFEEAEVPQAEFTTDRATADGWWEAGETVLCRSKLRGSGGRGITTSRKEGRTTDSGRSLVPRGLVNAPLYVKYEKKRDEYRVHVVAGEIIDIQQKRKRQEVNNDEVDYEVRNADNGWVFCRDGVDCPPAVLNAARAAVGALSLDFGAVDVGYNARHRKVCVYEVNTAPGVEGSTLDSYLTAFKQLIPALQKGAYHKRRNGIPLVRKGKKRRKARTSRVAA